MNNYIIVILVFVILMSLYSQEIDYIIQRFKRTTQFKTSSNLVNYYGYHMR